MPTRALNALVTAGVFYALWLIFVCRFTGSELLVGVGAAALAAFGVESVRVAVPPRFLPRPAWLRPFFDVPLRIVRDCGRLVRHLARGAKDPGAFELVRFPAYGSDEHAAARRALGILYTTLPPNTLVVGIDRERDLMLLHKLVEDAR